MRAKVLTIIICLILVDFNVETAKSVTGPAGTWEASDNVEIQIDASAPQIAVSPDLYGFFFEEINHAGDGGLYAELVENRDFESSTVPEGWRLEGENLFTPLGCMTRVWFDNDLPSWSLTTSGSAGGMVQLDTASPLNERNPHSLRLTVTNPGQRCGIANDGYWGMNFESGESYNLSFYARTENDAKYDLTVSLESSSGDNIYAETEITGVGGPWKKYSRSLNVDGSDPHGRLVISLSKPGTIWFDVVSLFPAKTFKGRPNGMRQDLAQLLADINPGFLRFPGGCIVEGITLHNRIRWKDSIGDISQRRGDFDLWGYYNTYGLGYHEYLQLAEDLGAVAMYVFNVGISCQVRRRQPNEVASMEDLGFYVQEALDAIEYAIGPVTSKWGAQRAANGHPEPFKLKYVEIGNENRGPDYQQRYKVFYDAIKQRFPEIITIADTRLADMPMEMVDDHYYSSPSRFFRMANHYDDTDREGPKIYVGEYAVNNNVGRGNLLGALSEAVFMLNMESNSDIVVMCSYAPLFENINARNWSVNLILLDSSRSVGRSSYQVQKLFALNRPDVVLKTHVLSPEVKFTTQGNSTRRYQVRQLYALAGLDKTANEIIIKAVNPTPSPINTGVTINGLAVAGNKAKVVTLGHSDIIVENTLDNPNVIVPVKSEISGVSEVFSCTFKPNSLTVLRIPAVVN